MSAPGSDNGDGKPGGRGRIWTWLLVVSLALNLLVLGTLGGALMSGRIGPGGAGPVDLSMGPLIRALSDDDRRALREDLRRRLERGPAQWRGHGRPEDGLPLERLVTVLRTEPFDAALLRDYLQEQTTRAQAFAAAGREAFIARVAALPAERRAQIAQRLEDDIRRRGPPPAAPAPRGD